MTRIRTLHDVDNLQKWNLENRKKDERVTGIWTHEHQIQSQVCLPHNHEDTVEKKPQFFKVIGYEIYKKKSNISQKMLTTFF